MTRQQFFWSTLKFAEAIAYHSDRRNVDTDSWRDLLDVEHDAVFVVAGAKGAILQDFRDAVDKAISKGTTLREFQQQFDRIVAIRGWDYTGDLDWRSNLIWETNLRSSYGKGREAQIQQAKSRRPFAQWRHGGSADPRPEHIANDRRVYRVDERPTALPHGWGCRCVYLTLSQRDMTRMGLSLSDPLPVPDEPGWSQQLGLPTPEEKERLLEQVTSRLHPQIAEQVRAEVDRADRTYTDWIDKGRQFAKDLGLGKELPSASGILNAIAFIDGTEDGQVLLQQMPDLLDRLAGDYSSDDAAAVKISRPAIATSSEENFREAINSFAALTKGRGLPSRLIYTDKRASSFPESGLINVGLSDNAKESKRIMFHEMGHLLEVELGLMPAARAWVRAKATGPETLLTEITGFDYGDETAYPDDFSDPYVGKIYEDGYTEVISVGMEHFVSPFTAAVLRVADPEHFYFMLGILTNA